MNFPRVHKVTGISLALIALVAVVFIGVIFGESFTADQKTMVITGAIAIGGAITGYWLNSSADKQPPEPPPRP